MKRARMGAYETASLRRRRRKQLKICLTALIAAGIVGAAGIGLNYRSLLTVKESTPAGSEAEAETESTESNVQEPEAAAGTVNNSDWNVGTAVAQTLDATHYSPDWRMNALPKSPSVELSYFDTATFVGDSLTQGLELYSTGLPNAHYCAYKSIGPNAIVEKMTLTRASGEQEIAIDALVASQPDYVYMLLGTNSLVTVGNDDSFIAYYSAMIDMFREALPEGVTYYVQAIPAVRADVVNTKPGLDNARIRQINCRLAQLAMEKGCYFIDLQEALTGADGNQIAEYAAADGIHYNATGYQAWVDYLRTHTVYNRRNPYVTGNPYYIDPENPDAVFAYTEPPVEETVPEETGTGETAGEEIPAETAGEDAAAQTEP